MTAAALPVPTFVELDVAILTARLIARYEADSGRTLQPAQVERLLIDLIAYDGCLLRQAIQETGEQSLVAFARYPMLDHLGALVGVERLAATAARVTLRATLEEVSGAPAVVPAGTRVRSTDRARIFETVEDCTIAAGGLTADVEAIDQVAGVAGSGYAIGQINDVLDTVTGIPSIVNIDESTDGADQETDDALRVRIPLAWARFSVAGSVNAYKFLALSAHAAVVDAAITSPAPGQVRVSLLANTGTPSGDVLAAVSDALSHEDVRPLTDQVSVVAASATDYAIAATVRLYRSADAASVMAALAAAADAFAADRRGALGRDIVLEQIIARLMLPGVYGITLVSPLAAIDVTADHWAHCTGITLVQGAPVDA